MKTPLNNAAFTCIIPRFPADIVDYTRLSARMLPPTRLGVVGKILLRPLIWLLKNMSPTLAPPSFDSPLLIAELVLFLRCPFYIDRSVIHVFIQPVMSY